MPNNIIENNIPIDPTYIESVRNYNNTLIKTNKRYTTEEETPGIVRDAFNTQIYEKWIKPVVNGVKDISSLKLPNNPEILEKLTSVINQKKLLEKLEQEKKAAGTLNSEIQSTNGKNNASSQKQKNKIASIDALRLTASKTLDTQVEALIQVLIKMLSPEQYSKVAQDKKQSLYERDMSVNQKKFDDIQKAVTSRLILKKNYDNNLVRYYIGDVKDIGQPEAINIHKITNNLPDLIVSSALRHQYQQDKVNDDKIVTVEAAEAVWLGTLPIANELARKNSKETARLMDTREKYPACEAILKNSLREGLALLNQNKKLNSIVFSGLTISESGHGGHFEYYELRKNNMNTFDLIDVNSTYPEVTGFYDSINRPSASVEHIRDVAITCGIQIDQIIMHRIYDQTNEGCGAATTEVMLQRLIGTNDFPLNTPIEQIPLRHCMDETELFDSAQNPILREEGARLRHAALIACIPQTEETKATLIITSDLEPCSLEYVDDQGDIIDTLPAPGNILMPYFQQYQEMVKPNSKNTPVNHKNPLQSKTPVYPVEMLSYLSNTNKNVAGIIIGCFLNAETDNDAGENFETLARQINAIDQNQDANRMKLIDFCHQSIELLPAQQRAEKQSQLVKILRKYPATYSKLLNTYHQEKAFNQKQPEKKTSPSKTNGPGYNDTTSMFKNMKKSVNPLPKETLTYLKPEEQDSAAKILRNLLMVNNKESIKECINSLTRSLNDKTSTLTEDEKKPHRQALVKFCYDLASLPEISGKIRDEDEIKQCKKWITETFWDYPSTYRPLAESFLPDEPQHTQNNKLG